MVHLAARQVGRQRLPLGLFLLVLSLVLLVQVKLLDLARQLGDVGIQCLVQQALLLGTHAGAELLAGGGELQPLQHRHLVGELVDERLLERDLARVALDQRVLGADLLVLGRHVGQQRPQHRPQLLRIERVQLLRGDHGA